METTPWWSGNWTGSSVASSSWSTWVGELQKQGIQFKSLADSMDTGTPSGRLFFYVMATLAEMIGNSS